MDDRDGPGYHVAASLRDVIEKIVAGKVRSINPPPRIGRVQSIDRLNNICWIVFPGDANSLRVKMTFGNQPQFADFDDSSGLTTNGDIVRVNGRPGNYYITDILTSSSQNLTYEQNFVDTNTRLDSLEISVPIVVAPVAPVLSLTGMPRGLMIQVVNAQPDWTYTFTITDLTADDTADITASYPDTKRPIFYTEKMPDGTSLSSTSTGYYFQVTATNGLGSASATTGIQTLVLEDSNTIAELAVGKILAGDLIGAFALLGAINIGANIEMTPESGIVIHTPLGDTVLPADGQAPQFTGSATFNALTVLGNLGIRGITNEIGKGGNLQLASATTPPKASPVMSGVYPEHNIHEGYYPRGLVYHTTRSRYLFVESLFGCTIDSVIENVTTGDYEIQYEQYTNGTNGFNRSEIKSAIGGIAIAGDTLYLLCQTSESSPGTYNARYYVYQLAYTAASANQWTFVRRWLYEPRTDLGGYSTNDPSITVTPSGEIWIAQSAVSTGYVWIHRYTTTGTLIAGTGNRLFQADGVALFNAPNRDVRGIQVTSSDTGSERLYVVFDNGGIVYAWETNMADAFMRQTADEFPLGHSDPRGLLWDPVDLQFKTRSGPKLYDYSAIRQRILSSVQTWRLADATGPDFAAGETSKSPPSITSTFPKRAYLKITSGSAIPDDTSDLGDPDSVSFYIAQNDTTNLNTSFKRQTVPAAGVTSVTLFTLPTTGGNPPTTTSGFVAGTPATISSDASDSDGSLIILRGDGSGRVGPWKWDSSAVATAKPNAVIAWFQSSSTAAITNTVFTLVTGWTDVTGYTAHPFCTIPGGSGSPAGTSTILENGSYEISATVSVGTSATGRRLCMIYINGTEAKRTDVGIGGSAGSIQVSHRMYLSSGDQVAVYVWQNSTVSINLNFHHDFQITKI